MHNLHTHALHVDFCFESMRCKFSFACFIFQLTSWFRSMWFRRWKFEINCKRKKAQGKVRGRRGFEAKKQAKEITGGRVVKSWVLWSRKKSDPETQPKSDCRFEPTTLQIPEAVPWYVLPRIKSHFRKPSHNWQHHGLQRTMLSIFFRQNNYESK